MFSWICPQCGREVLPSEPECPVCSKPEQEGAPPAQTEASPPAPPAGYQPPAAWQQPQQPPPQLPPQAYGQQPVTGQPPVPAMPYYVPVKQGMPGWLVTILVALGLSVAGAGAWYFLMPHPDREAAAAAPFEEPPEAASPDAPSPTGSSLARHLEVTGIRIYEENKRAHVRVLLVNHSLANLPDLRGTITLRTKEDKKAISTVPLRVDGLGSLDSREISGPLRTSLRAYEIPDWQFLEGVVELTSP